MSDYYPSGMNYDKITERDYDGAVEEASRRLQDVREFTSDLKSYATMLLSKYDFRNETNDGNSRSFEAFLEAIESCVNEVLFDKEIAAWERVVEGE